MALFTPESYLWQLRLTAEEIWAEAQKRGLSVPDCLRMLWRQNYKNVPPSDDVIQSWANRIHRVLHRLALSRQPRD